jgi:ribosomal RNA-processing protein 9
MAVFRKLQPDNKSKRKGKQKTWIGDINGHTDEVLALALSGDGKYLASGGKDRKVGIWDVEKEVWLRGFGGHKDTVSVSDKEILSTA